MTTTVAGAMMLAAQSLAAPLTPPLIEQGREEERAAIPEPNDPANVKPGELVAVDAAASAAPIKGVSFVGVDAPARVAGNDGPRAPTSGSHRSQPATARQAAATP